MVAGCKLLKAWNCHALYVMRPGLWNKAVVQMKRLVLLALMKISRVRFISCLAAMEMMIGTDQAKRVEVCNQVIVRVASIVLIKLRMAVEIA